MAKKSADRFMETLQDPDMVGASEYRAVHELLRDVVDGMDNSDSDADLKHLECVLTELAQWTKDVQSQLHKYRKG